MKILKYILPVILLFGCKEKETPFLTVETNYVEFSFGQDAKIVSCSSYANAEIKAESSQPTWCTTIIRLSQNGSNAAVEISVSRNDVAGEARTAIVSVSAGKAAIVQIEVRQASPAPFFNTDITDFVQFFPQADQQRFTVNTNVPVTVVSSELWCTAEISPQTMNNNLTVSVSANKATANRTAVISLSASGFKDLKINVLQKRDMADRPDMNIKGFISCNGVGIPKVVVSDGYEVTRTDNEGLYYLSSQKKNRMVFMSIPGNYEPPVAGNMPQFFKKIDADVNTVERMDFDLTAVNNDEHVFLAFADSHLANRSANNDMAQFSTCLLDMNAMIESYQSAGKKTYVLTLGDLTWDAYWSSTNWYLPQYADLLKNFKTTVFNSIGNHDHDPFCPGNWIAEQAFRNNLCPNWYSFNLGKVHYVVLDDVIYNNYGANQDAMIMGDRTYDNTVENDQIEWLKKDLQEITDKSTPIVIAMHSPLYHSPNASNTTSYYISNGQTLVSCLSGFDNVLVLSGHIHINYRFSPSANTWLMEHNIAALSATWWITGANGYANNHICRDGSVGGYGVYDVNGKDMKWFYKSVGYGRDYQFRTYDRNRIHITAEKYAPDANATFKERVPEYAGIYGTQHNGNEVYINVWGYDPAWKVEVTEGSVPLTVTRISATDPLHIISCAMLRLNRNAEPSDGYKTLSVSHFFKVTASTRESTLNIKVTDRFGNVYSENMTRPKELTVNMK